MSRRVAHKSAAALADTPDMECRENVTDVGAPAGIHTLNMYGCTGVTDMGALAGINCAIYPRCYSTRECRDATPTQPVLS